MNGGAILIFAKNLRRIYPPSTLGGDALDLKFPDVLVHSGRRIALLGVSGSGKSTLLNLIAGLDAPFYDKARPPSITYQFSDGSMADMADRKRMFPRHRLGFVFQEGHLLTDASAGINAALPGLLNGISGSDADVIGNLDALGLPAGAADREVWRLSGGQKQRVAILRALFHQPQVIFADEPTSSLDKRTAAAIMEVLVGYQEAEPGRTLFWATHDLRLAAEFATDFLIVRKPDGQQVQLDGPFSNPGLAQLAEIEAKVYDGISVAEIRPRVRAALSTRDDDEVPYTQAKVGGSLTFAVRRASKSLFQVGPVGRWLSSIESRPPPLLTGFPSLLRLYGRFSDRSEAYAILLSVLMTSLILIGLNTMEFFRNQAMSDPNSCHIVASAPDMTTQSSSSVELTPGLITDYNENATWRDHREPEGGWRDLFGTLFGGTNPAIQNACGKAPDLVFGRNMKYVTLRFERNGQCDSSPLLTPKALVANLAEPAILESSVLIGGAQAPRRLGDLIPQGHDMLKLSTLPLTGEEVFVTEGLREQLANQDHDLPKDITSRPLCISEIDDGRRVRIGGIVSGLPQPRGIPYSILIPHGSPLLGPSETYEQAVFYTNPEKAEILGKFLKDKQFAFSQEELERMTAVSARFAAIRVLIYIVGLIVIVSIFFFLLTSIQVFLEKNARPNAVLRAYGLTSRILRRQIFWRLGAIALYAMVGLAMIGATLSFACCLLFQLIGLPLPSLSEVAAVIAFAIFITLVGVVAVVRLTVWLWWNQHENIAQELN